jgi:hypothetical protein
LYNVGCMVVYLSESISSFLTLTLTLNARIALGIT